MILEQAWLLGPPLLLLLFVGAAAFVKIGVVLGVLRNGFMAGAGIPSRGVTTLVALLLSGLVMAPVAERSAAAMLRVLTSPTGQPGGQPGQPGGLSGRSRAAGPGQGPHRGQGEVSLKEAGAVLSAGIEPLRDFLIARTPPRERAALLELARSVRKAEEQAGVGDTDLVVLAPAFVLSELRLAFEIGFLLLLPFLVLDLLVSSLLQGLALPGLSAASVALPFKLLLFVLCDGWHLLSRGLILGYT